MYEQLVVRENKWMEAENEDTHTQGIDNSFFRIGRWCCSPHNNNNKWLLKWNKSTRRKAHSTCCVKWIFFPNTRDTLGIKTEYILVYCASLFWSSFLRNVCLFHSVDRTVCPLLKRAFCPYFLFSPLSLRWLPFLRTQLIEFIHTVCANSCRLTQITNSNLFHLHACMLVWVWVRVCVPSHHFLFVQF